MLNLEGNINTDDKSSTGWDLILEKKWCDHMDGHLDNLGKSSVTEEFSDYEVIQKNLLMVLSNMKT